MQEFGRRGWLLLLLLVLSTGCSRGQLERTPNLERLNARLSGDSTVSRSQADDCVRVHSLWKDQLRISLEMARRSAREREASFVETVYRPHRRFWEGYVGDERSFIRRVARSWTELETDPRAAIPFEIDVAGLLMETSRKAAGFAQRPVPCADWYVLYGPGWTNMGGLSTGEMLVDLFGLPRDGGAEDLRIYAPHEIAHLMFGAEADPDAGTLLHTMLQEGFATYFSVLYSDGAVSPARALGYSQEEWDWALLHEDEIWRTAKPDLQSRDEQVLFRFRAARERILPEAPGKIGYFLGYRIIEAYVARQDVDAWRRVFDLPSATILSGSGYEMSDE